MAKVFDNITVNYSLPIGGEYDALIMEQLSRKDDTGKITRLDITETISSILYGTEEAKYDCGVLDGEDSTAVLVFPFEPSLAYDIGVTHGDLGGSIIAEITIVELIQFSLDLVKNSTYPIQSLESIEWYGDVFDEEGSVIDGPDISVGKKIEITVSEKVYGTSKIEYKTTRHYHPVLIKARSSAENVYESTAWARWDGGVRLLTLASPNGAEEDYQNGTFCWDRSIADIVPLEEPPLLPPAAEPNSRRINIEYCSQGRIVPL